MSNDPIPSPEEDMVRFEQLSYEFKKLEVEWSNNNLRAKAIIKEREDIIKRLEFWTELSKTVKDTMLKYHISNEEAIGRLVKAMKESDRIMRDGM